MREGAGGSELIVAHKETRFIAPLNSSRPMEKTILELMDSPQTRRLFPKPCHASLFDMECGTNVGAYYPIR